MPFKDNFTRAFTRLQIESDYIVFRTCEHLFENGPELAEAFFKEFKDYFEPIYKDEKLVFLTDINVIFIKTINHILGINTQILDSRSFELLEDKTMRLVNICEKLNATDYYTGPASKNYMDEGLFEKSNINVHYFDYSHYPEYSQFHGDFTHNVSILDLLFNTGMELKKYMKSFHNNE
jgi:hypothetical protein